MFLPFLLDTTTPSQLAIKKWNRFCKVIHFIHMPEFKITLSSPGKVFWPEEGYTKLGLARFYVEVFPALAPFMKDRLLSLERCPDGMLGECFYQREKPKGMPTGTPTMPIVHAKGTTNYVVGGALATQIALVDLGCISIHMWNARTSTPHKPDWVCFDIDPSGEFADAVGAALKLKEALDGLNLVSYVKTSGKRGLHVFVPIHPEHDNDQVRAFADQLGHQLALVFPEEMTMEPHIAAREGRVYLDSFRNGFSQTVVSPYSVRRAPSAPISTPLSWSEVVPGLNPSNFNMGNFHERLQKKDPWADFFASRQSLGKAMKSVTTK
jgi:bifunctional non-homologous end joining protein LigD